MNSWVTGNQAGRELKATALKNVQTSQVWVRLIHRNCSDSNTTQLIWPTETVALNTRSWLSNEEQVRQKLKTMWKMFDLIMWLSSLFYVWPSSFFFTLKVLHNLRYVCFISMDFSSPSGIYPNHLHTVSSCSPLLWAAHSSCFVPQTFS